MSKSKMIGVIINDFEVVDSTVKVSSSGNRYACYVAKCVHCGNVVEKSISNLKRGDKCKCQSNYNQHGLSGTRLYSIYHDIIARTENSNERAYKHYGGRGIKMYAAWRKDFKLFYDWAMNNGYADNLTIDRIDVNGDYEPDNCRWATLKEQQNNRRNNHFVNYKGEVLTTAQVAEKCDINYHTLQTRIHRDGKSLQEAVETSTTN
jgi:hypothetical protein